MTRTSDRLHLRVSRSDRDLAVRMLRTSTRPPVGPQTLQITPAGLLVRTPQRAITVPWTHPATITESELHFVVEFRDGDTLATATPLVIPKTPNATAARDFVARSRAHLDAARATTNAGA